jgi:alpha-1,3-glucosyltransferase
LALNFFSQGRDLLGAVCFVASLGFKQMALYYAPAIGSYLLGKCIYLGWKDGYVVRFSIDQSTTYSL